MYFPNADIETEELLKSIGVTAFRDLIQNIPPETRLRELLLPPGMSEMPLEQLFGRFASHNSQPLSFIGAGAYDHYVPAVVKAMTSRGEFTTAYTPYQPEASQGTLQAIFEFQSLVAELYGMDIANASVYDGANALVEAVLMSVRHTGRKEVLLPDSVHPHYRQVLATYLAHSDITLKSLPCPYGTIQPIAFKDAMNANTACAVIQNPNFFGCLEPVHELSDTIHRKGALFVASAYPVSLGVMASPGSYGADIAVGDGQSLGIPLNYGGPYVGLLTCKQEHMRRLPGRIAGQTVDRDGKTAYVLTLQAREQHIRREKATSNICTNQNLCALAATVHMSLLGPQGIRTLSEYNTRIAHYAANKLKNVPFFQMAFDAPFFNEFVIRCPKPASEIIKKMSSRGITPGLDLSRFCPELPDCLLVNVTETKTPDDIDLLTEALSNL